MPTQVADAGRPGVFNAIIATLPVILLLSLLSFGISLAAVIWTHQLGCKYHYGDNGLSSHYMPLLRRAVLSGSQERSLLSMSSETRLPCELKYKGNGKSTQRPGRIGFLDGQRESLKRAYQGLITKGDHAIFEYLSCIPSNLRQGIRSFGTVRSHRYRTDKSVASGLLGTPALRWLK
jgi:hypothetical protein